MRVPCSCRRFAPVAIAFAAALAVTLSAAIAQPRQATAQEAVTVDIVDFAFSDASITIDAGTTVTWVNQDAVPHTATGDGGAFDTGQLDPGQSASITFDTPGTYGYFCAIHPEMTGTVVVLAADDGGTTDDGASETGTTDDDSTQLPTTGTGSPAGGSGHGLGALAMLSLLLLGVGAATLRRGVV